VRKKAKKRPGRSSATEGRVKFTTTLPEHIVKALRKLGSGNASQAIIMLVEHEISQHPSLRSAVNQTGHQK
jgi:hypothetical protein